MVFGIDAERLRVFRGERAEQRDADPLRVGRLSQDFAWFSPVLKRDLAGKRGDIAVRPRTEAEIRQVVAACASAGIPSPCAAAAPATTARARHCMAA